MSPGDRELKIARSVSSATARPAGQRRALLFIAGGQLLALTLWFSASAVAPQLQQAWNISSGQAAWLTLTVQIGFVVGALASSVFALPDAVASRKLFALAALAGAALNLLLIPLGPSSFAAAFVLRFLTGVALAGVYPSGLKAMAGWFRHGRGMALGTLVGALTIGSAGPHLIRGLGFGWQGVLVGASVLAASGALILWFGVTDGPYETAPVSFSWHYVGEAVRNKGVQLSTFGYLGHMWELYAMWTWTAAFLAASAVAGGYGDGWVPVATFVIIGSGGIGSLLAGVLADKVGRTKVAGGAMAISGTCALLTPLVYATSPVLVVGLFVVWGVTVVADSAQFSTMVTETAADEYRGTALALQTAIGFLLTLVTIKGVPLLAESWGWRWAFPLLAIGPAFGVIAMVRLKRSPEAAKLAGGLG
ncbi:MAG: MFS transporter [Actinobacteria bacterium]|nr:MFS transporter [Actinomycetota bacterium]